MISKNIALLGIVFTLLFSILVLSEVKAETLQQKSSNKKIPQWVKNNALWWSEDKISQQDFISGLEFLANEKILIVSDVQLNEKQSKNVPSWIKNNAGWWARGTISNDDFLNGVEYLVKNRIISLQNAYAGIIEGPIIEIDRSSYAPNVAIDSQGKIYVVYAKTDDQTNIFIKTSNGKKILADKIRVNDAQGKSSIPNIGPIPINIGVNDEVFVLYPYKDASPIWKDYGFQSGIYNIFLTRSLDGAESFEKSVQIESDVPVSSKKLSSFTISNTGTVFVTWLDVINDYTFKFSENPVKIAKSFDGGKKFQPEQIVDKNICECCTTTTLVNDQDVFVEYRKVFPHGDDVIRDVVIAKSVDYGESFSLPEKINDDSWIFNGCPHVKSSITLDSKNRIHSTWYSNGINGPGLYYSISNNNAESFAEPIRLTKNGWFNPTNVGITTDNDDSSWITWTDKTSTPYNVMVGKINSDGVLEFVKEIAHGNNSEIVSENGVVALVWTSNNNVYLKTWNQNFNFSDL